MQKPLTGSARAIDADVVVVGGGGAGLAAASAAAELGRTVVLAFPNQTDDANAVHVHGHHVRLLDNLDDGWKPFWLDTILAGPRRTTRVAFVADNPGRWLMHAQTIGDRDAGQVAWFEVA